MSRFYEQLAEVIERKEPFVLALISGVKGSSPQRTGAKALFLSDGKIIGTLGGGCLEAEVHSRANRAMKSGKPETFEMLLDHDFGWDDGLICGGSVMGLILPHAVQSAALWKKLATTNEPIRWGVKKDFSISVADSTIQPFNTSTNSDWFYQGSGHVAQAVAPLAAQLEFDVTVFDDRPGLTNHNFFPPDVKLRVGAWHDLLKEQLPKHAAFGLIVTRGHQHDALVLTEWIHCPFIFLGMIGSRRKARIIREQFIRDKIATPEQFDKIACPVGVDISAKSTHEIAVSIMAQFVQKRAEAVAK
jgi:xanthine dehydrogenase accessory factor